MPEDNPARKSFEAGARTAREAADRGTAAAEQATRQAEQSYASVADGIREFNAKLLDIACPYRKPKQLTDTRESVDSPLDERSLQIDLVRPDRAVPTAGHIASRKPCPSPSAQRAAAQIPEASGPQQHRPAVACRTLSPGSRDAGRSEDHKAGDAAALAPCRPASLLALEIPTARWPTADGGKHSSSQS
jgi:hypothetical protein